VPDGAVDVDEPNPLVRGQQLVDAVQLDLERQWLPAESREIMLTFLGGLVGEAAFALPDGLTADAQLGLEEQLARFADYWMLEQYGSFEVLLAGSPPELAMPPAEQRAGFMTLGAFLARVSSPPQRAMYLTEVLACAVVPPPPQLLESVWDDEPRQTAKSIVQQFYANEQVACAACHSVYIGHAIALDRYDELGRYRESLDGFAIDTSYGLIMPTFEPRPAANDGQVMPFAAPAELGRALSRSSGVRACLIRRLNRQLGGAEPTDRELRCVLGKLDAAQGNFRSVLSILAPRLTTAPSDGQP
jgi:hypothetical protein